MNNWIIIMIAIGIAYGLGLMRGWNALSLWITSACMCALGFVIPQLVK